MIELMIVMAVLAVVSVLAAPSFSATFARNHLRGAAGEAYGDMQFARSEAVQSNGVVSVGFSATGYQVRRAAQIVKAVTFGGGVQVGSGSTMTVNFDPVRATATVANGPLLLTHTATNASLRLSISTLGRPEVCAVSGQVSGYVAC